MVAYNGAMWYSEYHRLERLDLISLLDLLGYKMWLVHRPWATTTLRLPPPPPHTHTTYPHQFFLSLDMSKT